MNDVAHFGSSLKALIALTGRFFKFFFLVNKLAIMVYGIECSHLLPSFKKGAKNPLHYFAKPCGPRHKRGRTMVTDLNLADIRPILYPSWTTAEPFTEVQKVFRGRSKPFVAKTPLPLGKGEHADLFSVARVRPRTSKGITDLLLLYLVRLGAASPSKKNCKPI